MQVLGALLGDEDSVADEAAEECTATVAIAVPKTDGDGLEPPMTEQVNAHVTPVRVQSSDALDDDLSADLLRTRRPKVMMTFWRQR